MWCLPLGWVGSGGAALGPCRAERESDGGQRHVVPAERARGTLELWLARFGGEMAAGAERCEVALVAQQQTQQGALLGLWQSAGCAVGVAADILLRQPVVPCLRAVRARRPSAGSWSTGGRAPGSGFKHDTRPPRRQERAA